MAKKEKRISINALEKVYKENYTEIITEEWFGLEVTIKRVLPINEVLAFVAEVVDSSFLEDGTYVPEVTPFFIRCNVLEHYANFTLPEDLSKRYKLVYGTDAFAFVLQHISQVQFEEIVSAIDAKIDTMCDSDITTLRAKFDEVGKAFEAVSSQLEDVVNGMTSMFSDVDEKTAALMQNLDPDSIKRIVETFNTTNTTTNKVIDLTEIKAAEADQEGLNDD